ncbi:MAG TPA: hypothetical protein VHC90_10225 [Bryobacteraceae bacterium]|nr:hypothetical protein [Bryobacteraceae bacterium]
MKRFLNASLAGLILTTGLCLTTPSVSFAQDHRYHDKKHNDDHEWNAHEDQAYRIWEKDHHRKEVEFDKLNARDQQNYWDWRHSHSDAQLKINIR